AGRYAFLRHGSTDKVVCSHPFSHLTSRGPDISHFGKGNINSEHSRHLASQSPHPTPPAIPSPQTATYPPRSSSPPTPAACASPSKRSAHRRTPPAAPALNPRSPPQPALLAESKSQHPQPPAPPRQNTQSPAPPESKPASSSPAAHPAHCAGKRSVQSRRTPSSLRR